MNKYETALHKQNVEDRLSAIELLKKRDKKINNFTMRNVDVPIDTINALFNLGGYDALIALRIMKTQYKLDAIMFIRDLKNAGYTKTDIENILLAYKYNYGNKPNIRSSRVEDFNISKTENGFSITIKPLEEIYNKIQSQLNEKNK